MHTDKVAYQVSSQFHNDLPHMAILNANDFNFLYGEKESLFFDLSLLFHSSITTGFNK